MAYTLKLAIEKFFEDLILDKIDLPREQIAQYLNEHVPLLKKLKQEGFEKISSVEELDALRDKVELDCGFWIMSKMPDQPAKHIRFSTCNRYPELTNASEILTNDYRKIPCKLKMFPRKQTDPFVFGSVVGSTSPAIVVSKSDFATILPKVARFLSKQSKDDLEVSDDATIFTLCEKFNQAENLDKLLRPSLVGIGSSTVFEPSVRLASEFDGRTYCFPSRDMWRIFEKVYADILCQPCKFQFDKVAVYKKGDFFTDHRDTVRSPNHVATLLIGTDYEYGGGEFCAAGGTAYYISNGDFVFLYTDILHSVSPVTKGTRVVLQFKVLISDASQEHSFEYSPICDGTEFWSSSAFSDKIGYSDDEDDINSIDQDESDENEFIGNIENNIADNRKNKNTDQGESQSTRIANLILARRFANRPIAFLLGHFYPQKHLAKMFLRGDDRDVFKRLAADSNILQLSLTCVRFKRIWCYSDYNTTDGVEVYIYLKNFVRKKTLKRNLIINPSLSLLTRSNLWKKS